ncbi:MAG: hypothetical protein KC933_27435 [Myxococcales bacterium]|nr:hypothetical protein [Myxococcales bacterium]MCB9649301.1 hypothetical protein [Deltaproteobacteria bacterium]
MRAALPAALLALAACATPPPTAVAPAAPAPQVYKVDFRGVFGGRSSSSTYDPRAIHPETMARVLLEPAALTEDDPARGMETWTRRRLVEALGQAGTWVLAPPPPACSKAPCYAAEPTAALRNLKLMAGRDTVRARVTAGEDGQITVAIHRNLDDPSLCPKGFGLKLGFVQLLGQVQTLPDGVIAAVFQELAILDAPRDATLELALPAPETEAFCYAIAQAFEATPNLAVDDGRYEAAAGAVLEVGLHPLYPKAPDGPPPPRGRRAP